MKKCIKCEKPKSISEFGKKSRTKDGLDYYCKKCKSEYGVIWRINNKEYKAKTDKIYRENNKEHMRDYFANYMRNKRRKDPMLRIKNSLRRRLNKALKGRCKSKKTLDLLGIGIDEFRSYFESQFQPGMTWDNYGEWHIDHIIPLASVDSTEELEKLCHYTNLQPLWAIDNLKKSDKIVMQCFIDRSKNGDSASC